MRLFVALEIPPTLRAELEARIRSLRTALPKARWSRAEAMHLTLSFLGETDPALLPALHGELAAAGAGVSPLDLRLHEVGAFPPRGPARVLWVGLAHAEGGPSAPLAALHAAVAGAVERVAGVVPEGRTFHPHVTLARCSPPWKTGVVERFRDAFGEVPAAAFRVGELVLFASELHPSGARYRVVGAHPLGGEA